MLLEIHPKDPQPQRIRQVVELLDKGGVVVCPTDTVYAFVCSAHQSRAVERVAALKGVRPEKAELSLICRDLGQLSLYARSVDTPAFRIMKAALPGPFTFILNASGEIPKLFKNKRRTVGIRVPDHPLPLALAEGLGHALVATSVHDADALLEHTADPEVVHERFGHQVDLVIDSGPGGLEGSTVIDLTSGTPEVLRQGKGPVEDLW